MSDAIGSLRKHVLGLHLVQANSIDSLALLKSTPDGAERAGHKYLKRSPNGHGGWSYDYDSASGKQSATPEHHAVVEASKAHAEHAMHASRGGAMDPRPAKQAKARAKATWTVLNHALSRAGMPEGALSGVKARIAESQKWGALSRKSSDAIDALLPLTKASVAMSGHEYLSRAPDSKVGWKYTYAGVMAHLKRAMGKRKAKRAAKAKTDRFWEKQTASSLRANPGKLRTAKLAYKSEDPIDALLPLTKSCTDCDPVAPCASCGDAQKSDKPLLYVRKAGPTRITHEGMQGERPGHKYIIRIPDGKGGWKYSYREPQRKRSLKKEQPDPEVQAQLGQAKKTAVAMQSLINEGKLKGTAAYHVTLTSGLLRKHEAGMEDFKAALAKAAPENAKVKARTKELHSALGKIVSKTREGKARYQDAHGLQDMTGARIVCKSVQDVKATVENLKKSFTVIEADDYVDRAKDGDKGLGYRSHHLILKDKDGLEKEVQIRTPFQDKHGDWCHDVYKPVNEEQERVMLEKSDEIGKYARDISDYFYQVESGKMGAEKVNCPDSVKSTFGCL